MHFPRNLRGCTIGLFVLALALGTRPAAAQMSARKPTLTFGGFELGYLLPWRNTMSVVEPDTLNPGSERNYTLDSDPLWRQTFALGLQVGLLFDGMYAPYAQFGYSRVSVPETAVLEKVGPVTTSGIAFGEIVLRAGIQSYFMRQDLPRQKISPSVGAHMGCSFLTQDRAVSSPEFSFGIQAQTDFVISSEPNSHSFWTIAPALKADLASTSGLPRYVWLTISLKRFS